MNKPEVKSLDSEQIQNLEIQKHMKAIKADLKTYIKSDISKGRKKLAGKQIAQIEFYEKSFSSSPGIVLNEREDWFEKGQAEDAFSSYENWLKFATTEEIKRVQARPQDLSNPEKQQSTLDRLVDSKDDPVKSHDPGMAWGYFKDAVLAPIARESINNKMSDAEFRISMAEDRQIKKAEHTAGWMMLAGGIAPTWVGVITGTGTLVAGAAATGGIVLAVAAAAVVVLGMGTALYKISARVSDFLSARSDKRQAKKELKELKKYQSNLSNMDIDKILPEDMQTKMDMVSEVKKQQSVNSNENDIFENRMSVVSNQYVKTTSGVKQPNQNTSRKARDEYSNEFGKVDSSLNGIKNSTVESPPPPPLPPRSPRNKR